MLSFVIIVVVVVLTILFGLLLAFGIARLDTAVQDNQVVISTQEKAINPALTMGFEISVQANSGDQIKEARKLAAKQAAALPRGANMRITPQGAAGLETAYAGAKTKEDPWTAAKIAEFHGWDGLRTGAVVAPAQPAAVAAGPAATGPAKITLVPGRDYPVIEITEGMDQAEKRKARIANSKAKSAAMKAAKAAGVPAAVPGTAAAAVAPPVSIDPPTIIKITDDMPADEVRKARIANSKAKSAFNKALKAAGVDPKTVEVTDEGEVIWPGGGPPASAAAPVAQPATSEPVSAAPSAGVDLAALGIAPPDFTVITDDMPADAVRQARIANSKAKSAFNKALKAAGVDPKSVDIDDQGNVTMPQAVAVPVPAAAPATTPAPAAAPAASSGPDPAALGISAPDYIELSDDMPADEKRQARIHNAKARSAYNKALKAAGIDPKSLK